MNAYELAEIMEIHDGSLVWEHGLDIANMLRQQADRIAELEKCLFQMQNACIDLTQKSAEPVAWMSPDVLPLTHIIKAIVRREQDKQHSIPLYTTPQIKELSDEEIDAVVYSMDWAYDPIKFARAILKKASEK